MESRSLVARDLNGKHIVIIGATGVLGAHLAIKLASEGSAVSAIVRDSTRLNSASVTNHAVADITDSSSLRAALTSLAPFDGVINAAGVVAFGTVAQLDDATLANLFAVNAIAPIVALRESTPHISEGGFFLNISAVVALQPMAGMAAYSASKSAVWGAMTAATRELRRLKIDVIDARPPHTETGLATRPLSGTAPNLPTGLDPDFVAARIVNAIKNGENDLPVEAFI
ncbi:MAG: SDR family NAD(P)-dependent oxidoreductase [Actinomycetota bacterium]|nr:SDR family NAD(P)-dependent oxidoreductase [Actinomycetota bacterium]